MYCLKSLGIKISELILTHSNLAFVTMYVGPMLIHKDRHYIAMVSSFEISYRSS
jgi:hypothetical protein